MIDLKWESHMQPVYTELTRGLQVSGPLLDHLLQERALTFEEHSRVTNVQPNTEEEKVRCMLKILTKKPPGSFEKFCSVLEDEQVGYQHLADLLRSGNKGSLEGAREKRKSARGRPVRSLDTETGGISRKTKKTPTRKRSAAAGSSRGERSASKRSKEEESCQRLQGETCRPKSILDEAIRTKRPEILQPTDSALHKPVTERHIAVVARVASSCWSQIGNSLLGRALCKDTVSANTSQTKKSSQKLDDLLWKWKMKEGDGATLEKLLQACDEANVKGDVETELQKNKLL